MTEVSSEIGIVLFCALLAALILFLSWRQGFFRWNPDQKWNLEIKVKHVFIGFSIYFAVSIIMGFLLSKLLAPRFYTLEAQIAFNAWLTFLLSSSILLVLGIGWRCFSKSVRKNIWRNETLPATYQKDVCFSLYGWCIIFPVVLFMNRLIETIIYICTGIPQIPDQIAVRFVKMTMNYPLYFTLAIISITIIAPLIEEFLFRGLLQSFIRIHLGSTQAIVITSICFSLFHFSFQQGLANIPIIASLLPLALILGFIYEKRQSLLASIGLHAIFNSISILNLYFLGDISCAQ